MKKMKTFSQRVLGDRLSTILRSADNPLAQVCPGCNEPTHSGRCGWQKEMKMKKIQDAETLRLARLAEKMNRGLAMAIRYQDKHPRVICCIHTEGDSVLVEMGKKTVRL